MNTIGNAGVVQVTPNSSGSALCAHFRGFPEFPNTALTDLSRQTEWPGGRRRPARRSPGLHKLLKNAEDGDTPRRLVPRTFPRGGSP